MTSSRNRSARLRSLEIKAGALLGPLRLGFVPVTVTAGELALLIERRSELPQRAQVDDTATAFRNVVYLVGLTPQAIEALQGNLQILAEQGDEQTWKVLVPAGDAEFRVSLGRLLGRDLGIEG